MAQSTEQSLLDILLKSRYPLTNYLNRQQQFIKVYSTTQNVTTVPIPPPEPAIIVTHKQKASLPPPPCFNVPDTLDFNASGYERNDEMDQCSGNEDDDIQEYDETLLLKSINNRMNDSNSDIIKRSSAIQLELSSYGNSSLLQKATRNDLNIINK